MRQSLPLALLLAAGCNAADARVALNVPAIDTLPGGIVRTVTRSPIDSGRWRLTLERTVQPAEGTVGELLSPNDLALHDDGTLFVAEEGLHVVRAYDSSGVLVHSFGRDGEGPGELRSAWIAIRGDTLAVQDPLTARLTIFRIRDGSLIASRPSACCNYSPIGIDGAGRIIMRTILHRDSAAGPASDVVRTSLDGSYTDTIALTEHDRSTAKQWIVTTGKGRRMEILVPLQPRDLHIADPRGGFLTAWTGEYMLRTSRNGRDTVTMFGRPRPSTPVSNAEKSAIIQARIATLKRIPEASLRSAFDPAAIPDQRPAFDWIATDGSGRRWIRLSSADTTAVRFDLFDNDGKWLDVVSLPGNGWPRTLWAPTAWSRDHVAVLLEDEASRPLVRVYRIDRDNRQ